MSQVQNSTTSSGTWTYQDPLTNQTRLGNNGLFHGAGLGTATITIPQSYPLRMSSYYYPDAVGKICLNSCALPLNSRQRQILQSWRLFSLFFKGGKKAFFLLKLSSLGRENHLKLLAPYLEFKSVAAYSHYIKL